MRRRGRSTPPGRAPTSRASGRRARGARKCRVKTRALGSRTSNASRLRSRARSVVASSRRRSRRKGTTFSSLERNPSWRRLLLIHLVVRRTSRTPNVSHRVSRDHRDHRDHRARSRDSSPPARSLEACPRTRDRRAAACRRSILRLNTLIRTPRTRRPRSRARDARLEVNARARNTSSSATWAEKAPSGRA